MEYTVSQSPKTKEKQKGELLKSVVIRLGDKVYNGKKENEELWQEAEKMTGLGQSILEEGIARSNIMRIS